MLRELAPVLVGLMVAGRVGSSMAAEIGTMRVTEQIDALKALATEPIQYLFVPRVIAGIDHAAVPGHPRRRPRHLRRLSRRP